MRYPPAAAAARLMHEYERSAAMHGKTIALGLLLVFTQSAWSQELDDTPGPKWWGGIGIGYGYIDADTIGPAGESGVWLQLQGGYRIDDHWLVGLEVGGVGVEPGQGNYDPND